MVMTRRSSGTKALSLIQPRCRGQDLGTGGIVRGLPVHGRQIPGDDVPQQQLRSLQSDLLAHGEEVPRSLVVVAGEDDPRTQVGAGAWPGAFCPPGAAAGAAVAVRNWRMDSIWVRNREPPANSPASAAMSTSARGPSI